MNAYILSRVDKVEKTVIDTDRKVDQMIINLCKRHTD